MPPLVLLRVLAEGVPGPARIQDATSFDACGNDWSARRRFQAYSIVLEAIAAGLPPVLAENPRMMQPGSILEQPRPGLLRLVIENKRPGQPGPQSYPRILGDPGSYREISSDAPVAFPPV
jgi:hypothetical protein